jgi:hypothetical protein
MEVSVATSTLTNMTSAVPKVIDPAAHAVLDYLTAGTFFAIGFSMLGRHKRAANLAFVNGASVLGLSMLTDYPGGLFRRISFQTHGVIDVVQAVMAGAGPALFGFAGDPEAQAFYGQAAVEAGVVAATNWTAIPA